MSRIFVCSWSPFKNLLLFIKQVQFMQSSSMTSSQGSMQSTLTGTDQLSITTSQGIGIAPGQAQQQMIKPQQPNITYQIQRAPATNVGLISTPSLINSKLLGQVNPQLVASSQSIVASQTGITVVAGVPGSGTKSPIVNVAVTKPQMIPRAQAQIRPTAAVNIVNNSATANGASLIQQQQLRMMSIAGGMSLEMPIALFIFSIFLVN